MSISAKRSLPGADFVPITSSDSRVARADAHARERHATPARRASPSLNNKILPSFCKEYKVKV